MTRSVLLVPAAVLGLAGCAGLIGASFDDAHLQPDASAPKDAQPPSPDGSQDAGLIDPMAIPGLFAWFSADFGITVQDGGGGLARWASHVPGQYADPLTPDLAPGFVANVQHEQAGRELRRVQDAAPQGERQGARRQGGEPLRRGQGLHARRAELPSRRE